MTTPVAWFEHHESNDTGLSFFQKCIFGKAQQSTVTGLKSKRRIAESLGEKKNGSEI